MTGSPSDILTGDAASTVWVFEEAARTQHPAPQAGGTVPTAPRPARERVTMCFSLDIQVDALLA